MHQDPMATTQLVKSRFPVVPAEVLFFFRGAFGVQFPSSCLVFESLGYKQSGVLVDGHQESDQLTKLRFGQFSPVPVLKEFKVISYKL